MASPAIMKLIYQPRAGTMPGTPLPPSPSPNPNPGVQHLVVNLANVTHRLDSTPSAMLMGCHTDLGYDHQIYGFYSQRIYGESFEVCEAVGSVLVGDII